jgi:hypothetical protein
MKCKVQPLTTLDLIDTLLTKAWLDKHYGANEKILHKLCVEWEIKSSGHWTLEELEEARLKFKSFKEDF